MWNRFCQGFTPGTVENRYQSPTKVEARPEQARFGLIMTTSTRHQSSPVNICSEPCTNVAPCTNMRAHSVHGATLEQANQRALRSIIDTAKPAARHKAATKATAEGHNQPKPSPRQPFPAGWRKYTQENADSEAVPSPPWPIRLFSHKPVTETSPLSSEHINYSRILMNIVPVPRRRTPPSGRHMNRTTLHETTLTENHEIPPLAACDKRTVLVAPLLNLLISA